MMIEEPAALKEIHEIRIRQHQESRGLAEDQWLSYIRDKAAECKAGYEKGNRKSILETEKSQPIIESESMQMLRDIRAKMYQTKENSE